MINKSPRYLLALSLSALALMGCQKDSSQLYTKSVYGFSTFVEIKLYSEDKRDIEEVSNIIERYSTLCDPYLDSTGSIILYDVNHTSEELQVSKELYDVLYLADSLKTKTSNYFSPYLFNVSELYKTNLPNGIVPSSDEVASLLVEANNTSLTFREQDGAYYVKRNGNGQIDLGGIAKGACLDALYDYFSEKGITNYLISSQSSILLGEKKNTTDGKYKVAIKDKTDTYFKLKNCGLATSSISEQRYDINGITYSHIVNPKTGSAIAAHQTCIIRGPIDSNTELDAYATAFMNMSNDKIKAFVEDNGLGTMIIDGDDNYTIDLDTYAI